MRRKALECAFVAMTLFASCARASGPTFVVDSTADQHDLVPGDGLCQAAFDVCTLRAAIEEANTTANARIEIPAIQIPLGIADLPVKSSMTIVGAGMHRTVITAANGYRIFTPDVASISLTLSGMTLTGADTPAGGGAVATTFPTTLLMDHVLVSGCTAGYGGAVYATGPFQLADCRFTDCHASGAEGGGALYVGPNAGGDIISFLDRCTFDVNTSAGAGGAIRFLAGFGELDVTNCTITGNEAAGAGGGIRAEGGLVQIQHATLTDNTSDATHGGGGISSPVASDVTLEETLLAGNYDVFSNLLLDGDCAGSLSSLACNILGPSGTGHCTVSGAFTAATPVFGPLQDNGGPTPTRALLDGSPGVDFGVCLSSNPQPTDQRGAHRVGSGDLGAYERGPCGDANGDGALDVSDVFFVINFLFAGGALPPGLADVNADAVVDVKDVFAIINALFAGGSITCAGT